MSIKLPSFIPTALPQKVTALPQKILPVNIPKNVLPVTAPITRVSLPINPTNIPKPSQSDVFDIWCASLPSPTVKYTEQSAWITEYQKYIYKLLEPIIINEEVRKAFVSYENMGSWVRAITHETFSAENNYETLEIIGDSLVAGAFTKYLYDWDPKITPLQVTSYNSNYLGKGKEFQNKFSKKIKLTEWVLMKGDIDLYNISEDVFESFVGVLDQVSFNVQDTFKSQAKFDLALDAYAGDVVYRFIAMIFQSITIDTSYGEGAAFNTLGEYAAALGTNEKFFSLHIGFKPDFLCVIKLTHIGKQLLAEYFPTIRNLNDDLLGEAIGIDEKQSKNRATEIAIKTLTNIGASPTWMRNLREDSQLKTYDNYDVAIEKAKTMGYKKLYVTFPRSTLAYGNVTAILQGISDTRRENLTQLEGDNDNRSYLKKMLLRKFISNT
jgi:hypothetical protein